LGTAIGRRGVRREGSKDAEPCGNGPPFIDVREQKPVEGFEMDGVKIGQILYRQRKGPDRITIRA
jgi:hypothetical protein